MWNIRFLSSLALMSQLNGVETCLCGSLVNSISIFDGEYYFNIYKPPLVTGHWVAFSISLLGKKAAINTHVKIYLHFSWAIPWRGIVV